ncbi:MAG: hypothetical protein MMC33_004618 [Icmadophila ericetorum]|nr:hypothetical protein [Icmadophila ericetorum]
MSSFFNKIRSNTGSSSPSTNSPSSKKDGITPASTPLEKLLQDAGPIRSDGSDKFFGMENFGNTCYCNSILQCLFYSVPFREQVINYPRRSPLDSINLTPGGLPRINTGTTTLPNGQTPLSPTKPRAPAGPNSARNPGGPAPISKPEDKDSPEYKKKQAILNGPILPMNYDNAASYGMQESLFTSLKDMFEAIIATKSRTGVVSPVKFLEILRKENEMFRTSMHQDAHEFLNLLLNEVVANVETNSRKIEADKGTNDSADKSFTPPNTTGTRTPSNTGWVHELFEGTLTSETKCLTCENVSQRDEAFLDLSVDLDQHSSVTSCLRKFSEEEMLCERNKFHCDMCGGLQEAEKRMKVKRLPKILALHLKRFKYTEDMQRLQKLFHRVVYPYHLRLFNTTDDAEDPDRLYELYAVVVHIGGGPYHGHYVAIIKTQDRGWLLFDDEMVEPVDKNYVRNFFGERPGLACAYVLFYQETTLEAVKAEQEAEGIDPHKLATHVPKEPIGLGLNGIKPGGIITNGIHQVQSAMPPPISPIEESDHLESLDKSVTAPPVAPSQHLTTPGTTPTVSSPLNQMQAMSPTKADAISKKERAKAEKERKAAEKEEEKNLRLKRKNGEAQRIEAGRKQTSDLKAALEASKTTKAEEDKKAQSETPSISSGATGNGTALTSGSTLSRFRQTSKSMKMKTKLWGSGSKDSNKEDHTYMPKLADAPEKLNGNGHVSSGPVPSPVPAPVETNAEAPTEVSIQQKSAIPVTPVTPVTPATPTTPTVPEKERKNRFSGLRKRTSAMLQ